ncbi:PRC-barrel domain-containing protein [Paracoccus alcaliphilus]|uniref:PRC-barrel domain-containing protein n=1 Tax=Paracoccus alcaliphilus TaxID=34002 RepID=A0A1H8NSF4_9RHOB|nr:PRC-barrel domain-containing protein [Paracoccus alcaliphilus]WCR18701.1 PRC-barrel domain-containing protein [Paracoccus alcaliphilus]SEO32525.1 PRC-barrel domain-containing protein [Paracoccus alcaliphilus]
MDHSNHPRLQPAELTEDTLNGAKVYGPDNETIGSVSHVHGAGEATEVVIDVGGFLGIGSKPVLVQARDLDIMRDEAGTVHALSRWSKDELKAMPEHRH